MQSSALGLIAKSGRFTAFRTFSVISYLLIINTLISKSSAYYACHKPKFFVPDFHVPPTC